MTPGVFKVKYLSFYRVSQKKVGVTTCNSSSNSHFFLGHLVFTWLNIKSKDSFEILRTCSFQNWPDLLKHTRPHKAFQCLKIFNVLNIFTWMKVSRVLTLLYPGGGHNDPPSAKSAPVLHRLHFEWPKLVDNSYLPLYYGVIFVSGPKIT